MAVLAGELPVELMELKVLKLKLSTKLCSIFSEVNDVLKSIKPSAFS
jgi:hypothetical protein